MPYLWIAVGGALGSVARAWMSTFVAQRLGETLPWGTIVVNIVGCFLIGLIDALTNVEGRTVAYLPIRQFLIVGILGGYTTFSAFSLQTLLLARNGQWLHAGANVLISTVTCLVAVWLGAVVAQMFSR
jgi:CrcB protein